MKKLIFTLISISLMATAYLIACEPDIDAGGGDSSSDDVNIPSNKAISKDAGGNLQAAAPCIKLYNPTTVAFNKDLSAWSTKVKETTKTTDMFKESPQEGKELEWYKKSQDTE